MFVKDRYGFIVKKADCSECKGPIPGTRPHAITCSTRCRVARHRRLNKPYEGFKAEGGLFTPKQLDQLEERKVLHGQKSQNPSAAANANVLQQDGPTPIRGSKRKDSPSGKRSANRGPSSRTAPGNADRSGAARARAPGNGKRKSKEAQAADNGRNPRRARKNLKLKGAKHGKAAPKGKLGKRG